jgi:glutamate dehydrogenase
MAEDRSSSRQELIERLEDLVREKFPADRSALAINFVRLYYAHVRMELMENRALLDLYGAALAHLGFARQRRHGEALVRVYNPTLERDGWECPHTVVEIVVEDMPFLVDSARMAVNRRDLQVLRIIHPVMQVQRGNKGQLTAILDRNARGQESTENGVGREAVMHLEILRQTETAASAGLQEELLGSLEDLRRAVEDWYPMCEALTRVVAEIEAHPPPLDAELVAESVAFLRWLGKDHFTFVGYRTYDLCDGAGKESQGIVPGSGLGILREESPGGCRLGESPMPSPVSPQSCGSGRGDRSCCS